MGLGFRRVYGVGGLGVRGLGVKGLGVMGLGVWGFRGISDIPKKSQLISCYRSLRQELHLFLLR